MKEYSPEVFEKKVDLIRKKKSKTDYMTAVIDGFYEKRSKYCVSCIKGGVCGFSLDDYRINSFNSCLAKNFQKCNTFGFFYYAINYEKNYFDRLMNFQAI